MFSSWRFALALQIPVQLFIFFGQLDHSCRSIKSLWCFTPVAHLCPPAPDPNPSAPQPKTRTGSRFRISDWEPAWPPQPGTFLTPPIFQQTNLTPTNARIRTSLDRTPQAPHIFPNPGNAGKNKGNNYSAQKPGNLRRGIQRRQGSPSPRGRGRGAGDPK